MIPPISNRYEAPPPRYFRLRCALLFCAPMAVNSIGMPYVPVWLESLKMSDVEIGIIVAIPMIIRVFAGPLFAFLADRIGDRAYVLIGSGVLSLITALALFFAHSFWPIAIIFGIQGAVYAPFVPVTEGLLMSGVRRWGYDYGQMRLWGSVAFIVVTLLGGTLIVGHGGGHLVLPMMATGFVFTVIFGFLAPRLGRPRPRPVQADDGRVKKSALKQIDFIFLMMGVALSGSSHAMLFAFSAVYWQELGFSGMQVGLLWAAGVIAEVVIFIISRWLVRTFSLWVLIFAGAYMAMSRWIIFPEIHSFGWFFVLQCFHAFTFATAHIGVQNMIVRRVSEDQESSAQGYYFFFSGAFLAAATWASGYLHEWYGIRGYYFMSGLAFIGLCFILLSWYLQPQRAGRGGRTVEST